MLRTFRILNDSLESSKLPAILSLLAKQGIRELHMKKYSEFPILEYTSGRCCMDDFYLQEIK